VLKALLACFPIPQANPSTVAVLVNEEDAGCFKGSDDPSNGAGARSRVAQLKVGNRPQRNPTRGCQSLPGPIQQRTRRSALRRRNRMFHAKPISYSALFMRFRAWPTRAKRPGRGVAPLPPGLTTNPTYKGPWIMAVATPTTFTPTRMQCALAYLANGDLPPIPRVPPIMLDAMLSFTISTTACFVLGVLIGRGIVH
jgi:hypothetical protein